MRTLRRTLLVLAFGALAVLAVPGQTQKKSENHAVPGYDPAQEVKIKGEVVEVKNYDCAISGTLGAHLVLRTSDGVMEVHLAPASFLSEYQMSFAVGDKVEILGNKVTFHDAPAVLARRITREQNEYFFRDAKGRPLWTARQAASSNRT
jgi:DNA/RNA endonuclease YhcR with UshA esterase domain